MCKLPLLMGDAKKGQQSHIPSCIKYIANELVVLGEKFLVGQLNRHCNKRKSSADKKIIDINSLNIILLQLGYNMKPTDTTDLRTWIVNNDCFSNENQDIGEYHDNLDLDVGIFISMLKEYKAKEYKDVNN